MNTAVFLIALLLQIGLTYCIASLYFKIVRRTKARQGVRNRLFELGLFLIFVSTVVPLCLYFPAWLGEKIDLLAPTPTNRMALLALGGIGLVVSLIGGWKHMHRE
jgi:magnesium-transporting ATPase (P-type)